MSRPQAAVASQGRTIVVSQAIRGTLLDALLDKLRRVDEERAACRKRRIQRPMLDQRAALLRQLAQELAR